MGTRKTNNDDEQTNDENLIMITVLFRTRISLPRKRFIESCSCCYTRDDFIALSRNFEIIETCTINFDDFSILFSWDFQSLLKISKTRE